MIDENKHKAIIAFFLAKISDLSERTPESIRAAINEDKDKFPVFRGQAGLAEKLACYFEFRYEVKQAKGKIIHRPRGRDEPWWVARKKTIPIGYWERLSYYWRQTGRLPLRVLPVLDDDTDQILDHAGDPKSGGEWQKSGMVLGHVQSGKTTNYSALMCKAADAGYQVIIVLAGMSELLRQQTQRRIDEAFIGKHLHQDVGVGVYPSRGIAPPIAGTSEISDFNKAAVPNFRVAIESAAKAGVPIVFVVKKNKDVLSNLRGWLKSYAKQGKISHPLLLIDDEADNASVNTNMPELDATRINGEIRKILKLFDRRTYIGYTATPFANIFIDPDTEGKMEGGHGQTHIRVLRW